MLFLSYAHASDSLIAKEVSIWRKKNVKDSSKWRKFRDFYLVIVTGDGLNVCGHSLLNIGGDKGVYFQIDGLYTNPDFMSSDDFNSYVKDNKKQILQRLWDWKDLPVDSGLKPTIEISNICCFLAVYRNFIKARAYCLQIIHCCKEKNYLHNLFDMLMHKDCQKEY